VRRALRLIDDGFLDRNSVDELASRLGMGSRHLHRLFLRHVGAPPVAMAQTRRLHFAKRLIDETQLPITDIAFAAGFKSIRRFNGAFQQTFRRAPRDLRRQRPATIADRDDEVVLRLAFRPPYDWAQVSDFLAKRAVPGIELVSERGYMRTARTGKSHSLISVRPLEGEDALELRVRGAAGPAALLQISANARRVFDVGADPALIAAAFQSDQLLAPLTKRHPGLRIAGAWDPFECAVRTVLDQQSSIAGAREAAARLVARAGHPISTAAPHLTHLFPTPAELANANLNGLGLTRESVRTLQSLAAEVIKGKLDFTAATDVVCATLAAVPGFSDSLAQYVALRGLGEPDAFPASDLLLRRMASRRRLVLPVSELEARAEAWRPWRGYAAMHLWRAVDE
jgi:AraC family transcriptional regulator of adaptative response / DNA-3-methyladenine glycosylase II